MYYISPKLSLYYVLQGIAQLLCNVLYMSRMYRGLCLEGVSKTTGLCIERFSLELQHSIYNKNLTKQTGYFLKIHKSWSPKMFLKCLNLSRTSKSRSFLVVGDGADMKLVASKQSLFPMEQHIFKNANNCLNTNIYPYL